MKFRWDLIRVGWFIMIWDRRHIEVQFMGLVLYLSKHVKRLYWDKEWNDNY